MFDFNAVLRIVLKAVIYFVVAFIAMRLIVAAVKKILSKTKLDEIIQNFAVTVIGTLFGSELFAGIFTSVSEEEDYDCFCCG